jgi:hypothetical protein
MKQASLVLAAATAGSLGVQAFTVPYTTVVANTAGDVPEIVGETAYLGGGDGVLAAPVKGTAAVKIYYEFVDPDTKVRAIMTWTSLEFLTLVNPKTVALVRFFIPFLSLSSYLFTLLILFLLCSFFVSPLVTLPQPTSL